MELFVYGTLTDRATARAVLDSFEYAGPAKLVGLRRVDGRYPTLAPGGTTQGRLLRTPDVAAMDDYEGVDRGLYARVTLPLGAPDAGETVQCYVGDPDALGAPVDWPGDDPFPACVRAYCRANDVVVRET